MLNGNYVNSNPINGQTVFYTSVNGAVIATTEQTLWVDEFAWSAVKRLVARVISGGLVRDRAAYTAGRPVTLDLAWVTFAELEILEAQRDDIDTERYSVILPSGRVLTVMFTGQIPVKATPIQNFTDHEVADYYDVILSLVQL